MNTTKSENAVFESQQKLVGLRALARMMKIPEADMGFLAIVLIQCAENNNLKSMDMIAQLLTAPPHIKQAVKLLIEPLRAINGKVTEEALDNLITESLVDIMVGLLIVSTDEKGAPTPGCRSSGPG